MTGAPTDFILAQHRLERSTRVLLVWYAVIVIVLGVAMGLAAMAFIRYIQWSKQGFQPDQRTYAVAAVVGFALGVGLILANTRRRMRRVQADCAGLPQALGGVEVHAKAVHPAARRLYHVVEEMALAAQLPMPRIFVLAHEPAINACALSGETSAPALCLTMGCLYRLDRDELQAVVAHGFTELAHRDPHRRLRIVALIAGLQDTTSTGLYLLYPNRSTGDTGAMNPWFVPLYPLGALLGVVLVVSGSLGYGLGAVLSAATIRKRIRLGDAATIAFTRDPQALASALQQVGAFVLGSLLLSPRARLFQPLFLLRTELPYLDLFDTHPPLAKRIRRIDPQWDGSFPQSHVVASILRQAQQV